jgi:hypothetical protein
VMCALLGDVRITYVKNVHKLVAPARRAQAPAPAVRLRELCWLALAVHPQRHAALPCYALRCQRHASLRRPVPSTSRKEVECFSQRCF